jgi:hypothetical protein
MTGPQWEDPTPQPTTPLEPIPPAQPDDVMGSAATTAGGTPPPNGSGRPPWLGWAIGAAVVVAAIGGFFGARALTNKNNSSNAININSNGTVPSNGQSGESPNGFGGFGGGNANFPGAAGTIQSINGSTLTISNTRTNSTDKVTTSSSTQIMVSKSATVSDIAKGDRLVVTGTKSGTTITATNINDSGDVTGAFGGFRRNGGSNGNGAPEVTPPSGTNGGGFFNGGGGNGANGGTGGNGGNGGRFANGNFATGTVQSVNGNTITLLSRDGTTTTVTVTSSTKISKTEKGSLSDLKTGDNVVAVGSKSSDGSIAATTISEGRGFGGFGRFGGGGNGAPGGPVA